MNKRGIWVYIVFVILICISIYFISEDNKEVLYESTEYITEESSIEDNLVAINDSNYDEIKSLAFDLVSVNEKEATEVLVDTNKYRINNGVQELVLDDDLSKIANIRAVEMAMYDKFSHERPDGSNYSELFPELNIESYSSGENIAYGYVDADDVCDGWKESSGHYANMINSRYKRLGVGIYKYNDTIYWVQIFSN